MSTSTRTLGLIGGMSWHSTATYYRVINEAVAAELGGHASARIVLQSLDFAEVRDCQVAGDWDRAAALLATAARHCEDSGADVVAICTNLMHKVADKVEAAIGVPLLHIGDAIADRARERGWDKLGLLGTSWVMEEDFYAGRLAARGLSVEVPGEADRAEADRVIFEELTQGLVLPQSRAAYAGMLERLRDAGAEAVVLACTEIELLVSQEDAPLPLVPSMRTHVEAAAEIALGDRVLV